MVFIETGSQRWYSQTQVTRGGIHRHRYQEGSHRHRKPEVVFTDTVTRMKFIDTDNQRWYS